MIPFNRPAAPESAVPFSLAADPSGPAGLVLSTNHGAPLQAIPTRRSPGRLPASRVHIHTAARGSCSTECQPRRETPSLLLDRARAHAANHDYAACVLPCVRLFFHGIAPAAAMQCCSQGRCVYKWKEESPPSFRVSCSACPASSVSCYQS
ncbi:uncharacterized protein [Triticum aestivum]|uniref:uncharacterized protein n=1 Tax=Triticum aestivum TaxID=4565 RepID=UPI001D024CD9|nr:uncharacterized protein LOC123089586 [Triticum aestivum]